MTPNEWSLNHAGPAESALLLHFCGRPEWTSVNYKAPAAFRAMNPQQRLANILWHQQITGTVQPSGGSPVVCLTESPRDHLRWLIRDRGWPPWALVFSRQAIYTAGGGPVWHARDKLIDELPDHLRHWAVRLNTNSNNGARSEWLHEREWRVPTLALHLQRGPLIGLLVGDPSWRPDMRMVEREVLLDEFGQFGGPDPVWPARLSFPELPWLWENLPRHYWNAATGTIDETPDRVQLPS
ncbi:hypothetical protein ACIA5G_52040 [Amycolatopsis sp. NPDC051758]|uniref:hypothetical protein n=1 Tax=Amycolatopsis sp. NPDC051758 TaxID=3363935 RepID=UPI0037A28B42